METKKRSSALILTLLTIAGIVLGCVVGLVWEDAGKLKPLGTLFINMMLCVAVPLIFFSISSAVGTMKNSSKSGKTIIFSFISFITTGVIAGLFVLLATLIVPLNSDLSGVIPKEYTEASLDIPSMFVNFLSQSDFISLFSTKAILPLMTAAILFGFAIRKCGGAESPVAKLFINISDCLTKTIKIINYYMPIGFFGFFAGIAAEYGKGFVAGYVKTFAFTAIISLLYIFIFAPLYTLFAAGVPGVRVMLKHIWKSVSVAFGTCSSIATVPTNIEQADDSGIPREISGIVVPLGSNTNMNGSVIGQVSMAIFLYGLFGKPFTIKDALFLVVLMVVTSSVTPGIPMGAPVMMPLCASILFPENIGVAIAIQTTLAKLLDPFTTVANASMDYIMSFVVTRCVEGKGWLKKAKNSDTVEQ